MATTVTQPPVRSSIPQSTTRVGPVSLRRAKTVSLADVIVVSRHWAVRVDGGYRYRAFDPRDANQSLTVAVRTVYDTSTSVGYGSGLAALYA